MQFTKMQIEIHGSLVTIPYHTKCTDPLYSKFTSKKILRSQLLLQPLPGHCLCSNSNHRQKLIPIYQSLPLIMGQLLQQKNHGYGIHRQIWTQICSKTLTTSKLSAFLGGRTRDDFQACHYGIQMIKMGFNHF